MADRAALRQGSSAMAEKPVCFSQGIYPGHDDMAQGAPVRIRLKDRKGGNMAEWPADLRVREFPLLKIAKGAAT